MSKKVLKEQHPWANINYIDYLSFLDPSKTNKFLPFMIKELKRSIEDRNERNRDDIKYMVREIAKQFRIDETVLYGMDYDMLIDETVLYGKDYDILTYPRYFRYVW
jgi:hypothetical protein